MRMTESRNLTSHTYNEETTQQILGAIRDEYFGAFQAPDSGLHHRIATQLDDLDLIEHIDRVGIRFC